MLGIFKDRTYDIYAYATRSSGTWYEGGASLPRERLEPSVWAGDQTSFVLPGDFTL